ncbi:hypothetical protein NQ318_000848 [Aromia moschata]|uniref:Uncharacterized protein n=1 Tax=Aromia moschata TaxID=1265417 RepID=A0AAV8XAS6_9CUCU|nr:hypothetical protein NQ318_000848 [Aromia moschata]
MAADYYLRKVVGRTIDRRSESESPINEDSSDTNIGIITNHIDSGIKTAGKQSTNANSFITNGTQNGIDRGSPELSSKQKKLLV